MARNTITISVISGSMINSCDGSGPNYTVTYSNLENSGIQVGDWITVKHYEAGDDTDLLSTYTYQVIQTPDGVDELVVKYITDDESLGDASPCDLNSGEGSSGTPEYAEHTFTRDLGSAFEMFVE
jgi:hypothetical protein